MTKTPLWGIALSETKCFKASQTAQRQRQFPKAHTTAQVHSTFQIALHIVHDGSLKRLKILGALENWSNLCQFLLAVWHLRVNLSAETYVTVFLATARLFEVVQTLHIDRNKFFCMICKSGNYVKQWTNLFRWWENNCCLCSVIQSELMLLTLKINELLIHMLATETLGIVTPWCLLVTWPPHGDDKTSEILIKLTYKNIWYEHILFKKC